MIRTSFVVLLYLNCLFAIEFEVAAQEFTAEGELTYRVFYKGATRWNIQKSYSLKRSGNHWLIHTSDMAGVDEPNHSILYEETGCDGANIFQLEVEDTFTKSWQALKSGKPPVLDDPKLITVSGKVSDGMVPVGTDFVSPPPIGANAIWLAFTATPYFDGITNGKVRTLEMIPKQFPELKEVQADWQKDAEFPHLLQSVNYHNNGQTVAWLPDGKEGIETLPAPYERGYVDATFTASGFTNLDGFHVPMQFAYTAYWPNFSDSNLVVASCVEGKLIRFKAGVEDKSFYPKFIRKAIVTDKRFEKEGVKDFNYTIEKDGVWWATNNPKITDYLKFYKKHYSKLMPQPKK